MENIKSIIFDMDGVIFDTEKVYLRIWSEVFSDYGYKLEREDYLSVMGKGRKGVVEKFLERYGEDLPITEMYKEKDAKLAKVIDNNEVPLKKGALDLLNYLKENNYKVALATSAKRERVDKQLKGANIIDKFDAIVTRDDIVNTKPNPDIFLKACELLGSSNEECLVIEDSSAGIRAAFNAKIKSFHVEDLKVADEEIKELSTKQFKSLVDIYNYIKGI